MDAADIGEAQGVAAALEEGDALAERIQQRQAEAGLDEPQGHPREARAGADIHHISDTGVPGMSLPQNIMAYSIAIRGERHTYHKMAQSVNR